MKSNTMRNGGEILSLTGLRGIAACWVVFFHVTQMRYDIPIIRDGYLGVDVFFILSGYVLSHVYSAKFLDRGFREYPKFILARIFRIYPLHLFALAALLYVVISLPGFAGRYPLPTERFSPSAFVASAMLIQNWFHWLPSCWNDPAWSLSAEWLAYLIFPVIVFLTQHWKGRMLPLCLAGLCLAAFAIAMFIKGVPTPGPQGTPGNLRMLFEFSCGALLFRGVKNGIRTIPWQTGTAAIGVLLFSLLVPAAIFLSLPAFALIVLTSALEDGPVAALMAWNPIVFLGRISFSIYLVHWPILQVFNWMTANAGLSQIQMVSGLAVTVAIILCVSCATYYLIEMPARSLGKSFGIRKQVAESNANAI